MIKIIHLSDLHFGTEQAELVDLLLENIQILQPDIILISGDLTQRARKNQFRQAKHFITNLPSKVLCVPGNHDIALYNLLERILYPFYKYKKWINDSLCAALVENNIAILGINSVTPYKPMGGYVTKGQLNLVKDFFQSQAEKPLKIIVMHHNLIRSERHKIINDAEKLIDIFMQCNVNMILCGHIHAAHIETLTNQYHTKPFYVITAGTAISTRTREPNSFNVIGINDNAFKLTVKHYIKSEFISSVEKFYSLK